MPKHWFYKNISNRDGLAEHLSLTSCSTAERLALFRLVRIMAAQVVVCKVTAI